MEKKNAPLFPQTTRSSDRQLSFHDLEKRQLPTLDDLQVQRLLFMRRRLSDGRLRLGLIDQMELVDIALSGVKANATRNEVFKLLVEAQADLERCRRIMASAYQTEDKTKMLAALFDVLGNPKEREE